MEKVFKRISDGYRWVTSRIPLEIIHFIVCFCAAFISWKFTLGLIFGSMSGSLCSADKLRVSLGCLLADFIGIILALVIKLIL